MPKSSPRSLKARAAYHYLKKMEGAQFPEQNLLDHQKDNHNKRRALIVFCGKKHIMLSLLQSSILFASLLFAVEPLELSITNISAAKGSVRIAVFASADDFAEESNAVFSKVIPLTSTSTIRLQLPLSGTQAHGIALYHDLNDNGKLDRNALGIPKEPYAFSNNPSAKWQAPSFSDIAFVPDGLTNRSLNLKLMSWSER